MRLIVITPEALAPGEPRLARAMLQHGLLTLHLRKPGATRQQLRDYLAELGEPWTAAVMLHSHHDLAGDFQVKGLHYREADVPAAAPPLPPPPRAGLLQSTSFHSLEQAARPWGPHLDYAFLSPVFDSISKAGYRSAGFDAAAVRAAAAAPGAAPLVALGGVTGDNLAAARAMGFSGAAVLGGVWGAPDPAAAVEALLLACERLGAEAAHAGADPSE
ncbi:MAG: thiamine phosphate synthase superfamily [Monoraphidium minutum]|nr:MAG: thiamine phosphate synthase superfamily [Monoraphidium minutum]